ncbi:DUF444 family protein [Candidatus Woesearchaeota archaeon]|nr:DUF444 family protein [Candidatus Woesearchaeota archaeon]
MSDKIVNDVERFKRIVEGRLRKDLKKHISRGVLEGMRGKTKITVPVSDLDLPHFKYGSGHGGVASGDVEEGQVIGEEKGDEDGKGEASDKPGEHSIEVEVSLDTFIDLVLEELELPRIEDKGKKNIVEETHRYTGIATAGPESLRHNKRTFKRALKRQISMGNYDPKKPIIIPVKEDKRYRARKTFIEPVANAVVIYMMDVSGSMGDEQKEIVRTEAFLIDAWLKRNYNGIDARYITHDAEAREVDADTFFFTRESGGTMISSAYALCADMIQRDYPVADWNIYPFHFSDGDNWGPDDTNRSINILNFEILPAVNMFGYGQVVSDYGSGQFIKDLREKAEDEKLVLSEILNKDGILGSIQDFFKRE